MYNLLIVLLLLGTSYEANAEPSIGQVNEGLQQGYQPGFTSDDLIKLVFQRYGKSDKGGALETVDESKASEPILEDESANNQKRAYPRTIPASNSLLAEQSEAFHYQPWNYLQKRYPFDRQLRTYDRQLRAPGAYAFDHLARMKKGSYAFDHLARMKKGSYAFDHLARMKKANYNFDHLARMRKANYDFDHLARMKKGSYAFDRMFGRM